MGEVEAAPGAEPGVWVALVPAVTAPIAATPASVEPVAAEAAPTLSDEPALAPVEAAVAGAPESGGEKGGAAALAALVAPCWRAEGGAVALRVRLGPGGTVAEAAVLDQPAAPPPLAQAAMRAVLGCAPYPAVDPAAPHALAFTPGEVTDG